MINSEYYKFETGAIPNQKSGKDLILAKLLQLTQNRWNKHFNDDRPVQTENKIKNDIGLQRAGDAQMEINKEMEEPLNNNSIPNPMGITSLLPFPPKTPNCPKQNPSEGNPAEIDNFLLNIKNINCLSKAPNETFTEHKLPLIKGIILKSSLETENKVAIDTCKKCTEAATSPESNKSITELCVKDKIQFFEGVTQGKDERRFLLNLYNSKISKEWLEEFEEDIFKEDISMTIDASGNISFEETKSINLTNDCQTVEEKTAILEEKTPQLDCSTISFDYDLVMENINMQCVTMAQAAKALRFCDKRKHTPNDTSIMIEAEKVLLVSGNKRELLSRHLRTNVLNNNNLETLKSSAKVLLSNLRFPLKMTSDRYKHKIWYVALFSCATELYATEVVEADPNRNYINFPGSVVFESVPPNFVIDINLFQMKIPATTSHKSISCIQLNNQRSRRIFQVLTYKDVYIGKTLEVKIPLPSFTFSAKLQISKDSSNGNQIHFLNKVSNNSAFDGTAYLYSDITNLLMNEDFCGFLTVGVEIMGRIVWDRKWCRLINSTLCFWEYPTQEESSTPKLTINLKYCSDEEIEIAGKDSCARSRTVIINLENVVQALDDSIMQNRELYYVTADSIQDMEVWRNKLNSVLTSMKLWQ